MPGSQKLETTKLISAFGKSPVWRVQPKMLDHIQTQFTLDIEHHSAVRLVSELARRQIWFEVSLFGPSYERYLHAPPLGIVRQEFDEIGEQIIRKGILNSALCMANGNYLDFERELRLRVGAVHEDILDNLKTEKTIRLSKVI